MSSDSGDEDSWESSSYDSDEHDPDDFVYDSSSDSSSSDYLEEVDIPDDYDPVTGVMHEADNAYSIWSTWSCYWLDQFLTLALNILILSIILHFNGSVYQLFCSF